MPIRGRDELLTERLLLRRWRPDDREPFARINADPAVMELLSGPLSRAESDAFLAAIEAHFEEHGYGLWALQRRGGDELIGLAGLSTVAFHAHFTPAVEVGWRLARSAWGAGYASEAARAALRFGFQRAGLEEIVSTTSELNVRSQAVMVRIGMSRDRADDFVHPLARPPHLRRHVLYRLTAATWAARQRDADSTLS
ncbi:MAG TPA: GNAT family N-acetyltransferase [Solirubrobacteraceae bacterium]|nr:GNAT family N-acetyltransferase [Solirubrobacteraceae bacterium]